MTKPTARQVHVNKPLTNISIAYMQNEENFVAHRVFPLIPVQKQSDRYFKYLREDWFRVDARERAPGTESAGSGFRIDNTPTYYAPVYAIHKDIDDQIRSNADDPLNLDRDTTEWVSHQLMLLREKIWMENYFQQGVWGTELDGTSDFTPWDDANSTPIEDITGAAIEITRLTGYRPNTLVLHPEVYNALKNNADIIDRIKYTQRGVVTTDILASLLDVERVFVAYGVQDKAGEGLPGDYDFIAEEYGALLCYSNPSPSILTPSAGYTFSWVGLLGAGNQGQRIKTFRMEHLSSDRIEGEMAFDMKVVAADLGVFFFNCLS